MTKTPAEWRRIVDDIERSGDLVRVVAERHDVTISALYYWRRRLAETDDEPESSSLAVSFVEAKPANEPPAVARYVVGLLNGVSVSVPADFDDRSLRRLLSVMQEVV